MKVDEVQVNQRNGEYHVSLSVKRSDVRIEEFEGKGETLAEAMFDLGDLLQAANV